MVPNSFFAPDSRARHYALLLVIGCITLFAGNGSLPLIDRDEPRFAQATREMIQREDWVIPYFNGEYRFDKPVMTYWLMRAAFFIFGDEGEFPARLPSVLSALAVGLILYEIGRRWFDSGVGLWAAGGWLTCLQVLIHGRMAVADMPLILAIVLSTWAVWELLHASRFDRRWFLILYGSLAFGFLTKGPLAPICPLLTLLLYRWVFWRKPLPWGNLRLQWGLPLAIALVGLWGIPALIQTGGLFWQTGMGRHVVERGMTPFNGRSFSILFYLQTSVFSLFPATAFLGSAYAVVRKHWNEKQAFLVSWLLGPYLIFSFYATQLPHYVLPAYPAAFLLMGQTIRLTGEYSTLRRIVFSIVVAGGLVVAGLIGAVALLEEFPAELIALKPLALCFSGLVLSLTLIAVLARYRLWPALAIPVAGLGLSVGLGSGLLRDMAPAVKLAPLFQGMPPDTRYFFSGFEEPSLIFYSNRRWDSLPAERPPREILGQPGPRLLVVRREERRLEGYLSSRFPALFPPRKNKRSGADEPLVRELAALGYRSTSVGGINTAHISWVKVDAWYKTQ